MQDEDFYRPTNIRDTIFAGIDLPQQSKIQKPSNKNSKYEQEDDEDDGFDIRLTGLELVSNVIPKSKYQASLSIIKEASNVERETSDVKKEAVVGILTRANSIEKSSSSEKPQSLPSVILKKPAQQVRRAPTNLRGKKDSKKPSQKNQVDLDQEIGQVQQWGHRDDDQKSSGFDKSDQEDKYQEPKANKQLQDELRKKAEEKAKIIGMKIENKSYGSQPKGLGLKAKAEQLKKKNEENNKILLNISKDSPLEQSTDFLNIKPKTLQNKISTQESKNTQKTIQSKPSTIAKPKVQPQHEEESQDDPWQKVNQKTKQQYQKKQERQANPLSKQEVIEFYSKKFIFAEEDIEVEFQLDNIEEEIPGCWDSLFGCFKSKNKDDQGDKKNHKNSKNRLAMRLVAISKISLNNTDEQFFILKEIWNTLTNKAFSRYGNHWNQIGFQGRDPATDLRSTGILSLLQWYQFIDENASSAKSIYEWTVQKDFPLALTHIKATGLFLKLIKSSKIRAKNWNEYQKYYNCIVWSVFSKIKKGFNESENVGEVVDKNLQSVRKNLSQCMKQYEQSKKD